LVAFASLVPLPDALVLLREQEQILVSRTIQRGHHRIPDSSPEMAHLFIRRAISTFDTLARMPMLQDRMLAVDADGIISLPETARANSGRATLLGILRKALGIAHPAPVPEAASSRSNGPVVISNDTGTD
jgi:hypothetical protein